MSGEKTEKPTQKKLDDSAEKGQSYKSRDIVAAIIVAAGTLGISSISLSEVGELFKDFISHSEKISTAYVVDRVFRLFIELTMPFVLICIVATILPSLAQSKFVLAFEAFKFNFDALNPVNGFKKIFGLKTVKEFIKALIYLVVFTLVVFSFFEFYEKVLLQLIYVNTPAIAKIWLKAGTSIILLCLLSFLIIIVFDGLADYFLYIKELKMEKHEVKQEHKEMEGNPEVKSKRREMHQELLSAQEKMDVEQSNFVLANPTHIAIGIFADPKVSPLPFVSLHAQGEKALAIIRYAERHGIPVVRDIPVARRLFKISRRYSFIPVEMVGPILNILIWLKEVELAHLMDINPELGLKLSQQSGQEKAAPDAAPFVADRIVRIGPDQVRNSTHENL